MTAPGVTAFAKAPNPVYD